jgi:HAD superfamily hydrolase (TIGR01549 family)
MIKAVFFDWFNTLAYCDPPRESLWRDVCRQMGYDIDDKVILRGIFAADFVMASPPPPQADAGSAEGYLPYPRMIFKEAGIAADGATLKHALELMMQIYTGFTYRLYDDVAPTLKAISARGCKVGVISNASNDTIKVYDEMGLSPLIDMVVTSEEAGFFKPQPGIFRMALERAGVTPDEAVHVGDQYEMDTVGALGAGMKAVLLDRYDLFDGYNYQPRINALSELSPLIQI